MPRTLDNTRKQITKKKGPLGALHERSRDSRRLRKALVRDARLEKLASTRRKHEQPLVDRAAFFQELVQTKEAKAFTADELLSSVQRFVRQYDEELAEVKQTRRAGRPASTREDLLKTKTAALEKELENGFIVPDLANEDNVVALLRWEGSWSQLAGLQWVRVNSTGTVRSATFPPSRE